MGIIFSGERCQQVLNGDKRQTRRPQKNGELPVYVDNQIINAVYFNGRLKWMVGRTYAVVPKRGAKSVGRLKLLEITLERIGEISETAIAEEGMKSREHLFEVWQSLYGEINLDQLVWALKFEMVN